MEIESITPDPDRIARLSRRDDVAAERLAELRHVPVDDVRRRGRRVVAPQGVDEASRRDDLACVEQQPAQDDASLRREARGAAVDDRFDGAQHAELRCHAATVPPCLRVSGGVSAIVQPPHSGRVDRVLDDAATGRVTVQAPSG